MRIVFIHSNLPSQYRHLIRHLTRPGSRDQVVCITRNRQFQAPGAWVIHYEPEGDTRSGLGTFEGYIQEAKVVYQALLALKEQGFQPEVICSHAGLGPDLFVKELFPAVPLVSYCEWYVSMHDGEWDFDPNLHVGMQSRMQFRVGNSPVLHDLVNCDAAVCPTRWQLSRFPAIFHPKIRVMHDGVDTGFFAPASLPSGLHLPGLSLPAGCELVTYVARGMDSVRGFPQFMEAVALLLQRRPHCHVVVAGDDRVAYGPPPPQGSSYKQWMLSRLPIDLGRLHFVGTLPYDQYVQLLQASRVHVYLTTPFILSWSMVEAMSTGCLIVASDTPPVRELVRDGENGLLVNFFDTQAIADRIHAALDAGDALRHLRQAARQTVLEHYDLRDLLPRHLDLITGVCKGEGLQP